MANKETLEFITKLIDSTEAQITYLKNKIVEDEQYPPLQDMHKEELITSQEYLTHLYQIKKDLNRLENSEKYIARLQRKIKRLEEKLNDIYDEYDECDMSKAEYWL